MDGCDVRFFRVELPNLITHKWVVVSYDIHFLFFQWFMLQVLKKSEIIFLRFFMSL